ncbi:hypothetical protein [Streptosporangium sp. NPDC087985]|uniref:hypothetical protein n=1 Tax=Streptosporangium sp. NPDC087985 TaxID=3366196 RepID=UPI0038177E77
MTAEDLHAWNGHIRFTPRYGSRENTSDVWALELAPKSALGAGVNAIRGTERERFTFSGGEVIIYDCADMPGGRWAAWVGPWHMAHGMYYEPEWEANDVIKTLSRVQWTDTPEGLTAAPGQRFTLERAKYFLPVAGVGTLQVEPKNLSFVQVPRWRGLSAPAGEVWRLNNTEGPQYESVMLVTETAVVTIDPWDVPRRGQQNAPSALAKTNALATAADFLTRVKSVTWGA